MNDNRNSPYPSRQPDRLTEATSIIALSSPRIGATERPVPLSGNKPGATFYTHISDQYAPFHIKLICATVRDATHVLDGLLYHESDLHIEEHYRHRLRVRRERVIMGQRGDWEFPPLPSQGASVEEERV